MPTDTLPEVSLEQQIEAADRELRMRRGVYPRRIAQGKMTDAQATHEIACMIAIGTTLRQLRKDRSDQMKLDLGAERREQALVGIIRQCIKALDDAHALMPLDVLARVSRRLRAAIGENS